MTDLTKYQQALFNVREVLRGRKDRSLKPLARRSGISESTWRRIRDCGATPSLYAVYELAAAEHLSVVDLLTEETGLLVELQQLAGVLELVPEASRAQAMRSMEAVARSFIRR